MPYNSGSQPMVGIPLVVRGGIQGGTQEDLAKEKVLYLLKINKNLYSEQQ